MERINEQKPLITIVVPVYKVPYDMLHRCLDSICAQTVRNFEVIMVDDGSPDDCGNICESYAEKEECFRVIHQKNGGLAVVRNVGIENAKGEWVCFVDGDDWIEPESMEFAESFIRTCKDGDVLVWEEIIDTNGILKYNCFFEKPWDGIRSFFGNETEIIIDKFFPRYYLPMKGEQYTDMGSTLGRLYNRDFLIRNNLKNVPGLKRMQDNVFNLWVFDTAEKVYYQTKHLYHYCFNPESATKRYTPDFAETLVFLFDSIREFIEERHSGVDHEEYNQRLYMKFIGLFGQLFELDYASSLNKDKFRNRVKKIKKDFKNERFREVLANADTGGQRFKVKVLRFLLLHELYGCSLVVSVLNRKLRPSRRTKSDR